MLRPYPRPSESDVFPLSRMSSGFRTMPGFISLRLACDLLGHRPCELMWGWDEEDPQIFSEIDCQSLKDAEAVESRRGSRRAPEGAGRAVELEGDPSPRPPQRLMGESMATGRQMSSLGGYTPPGLPLLCSAIPGVTKWAWLRTERHWPAQPSRMQLRSHSMGLAAAQRVNEVKACPPSTLVPSPPLPSASTCQTSVSHRRLSSDGSLDSWAAQGAVTRGR